MAKFGSIKWGTVENLKDLVDSYFNACEEQGEAPNIAGLCVALNISTETFRYYANGRYEERLSIAAREKKQELIEAEGAETLQEQTTEDGIYNKLPVYYTSDEIDINKLNVSVCLRSAKTRMENWWWKNGAEAKNPAMSIFALKAVHGYTDQPQEVNTAQTNIQLNIRLDTSGVDPKNQPVITFAAEPGDKLFES